MDINAVNNHIDNIEKSIREIRKLIQISSRDGLLDLMRSSHWPQAIDPDLLCETEEDKFERSNYIFEFLVQETLKNKTFLDFGCGEGHCVVNSVEKKGSLKSVGFDLKIPTIKTDSKNAIFTTSWEEVVEQGPYDVILLLDVLDHLTNGDPVTILKDIKSVLKDEGNIYVRFHPWMSRHATHVYKKFNKAFAHLILTKDELEEYDSLDTLKVFRPRLTYDGWIKDAELKIKSSKDSMKAVEDFFKAPQIAEVIKINTGFTEFPSYQMSLEYIDYILKK